MINVDLEQGWVCDDADGIRLSLGSAQGFALVSKAWLRAGWDAKHLYSFTWMGRPIIQLPDDLLRMQEVMYAVRPTLVVETGIAHGGSLVFYASLLKQMDIAGRVVGVDVEIRPDNRRALEAHELSGYLTLVEGNSVAPDIVRRVRALVAPEDRVIVVLDSDHGKAHVRAELEAYGPLVSRGSYIVAADGIMQSLGGAPRAGPDWAWNNPRAAAAEFLEAHPEFELAPPVPVFNEGTAVEPVTYWQGGWLRRRE